MDTRIEGDTCGETGTRNDVERECEEDRERDDRPVNIEKYKTRAFVHARLAQQRGRTERRQVPNGRGSEGPALELKKKTRLQMGQSELFWSFICEEFF